MAAIDEISIIPSVLPADFANLGSAVRDLELAGVDRIQWDVMDGIFVPNLTFGPDVIKATRGYSDLPFEAHLMIEAPERYLAEYIGAGCNQLIIHAESTKHLHRTLGSVKSLGAKAAVALNPATPIEVIENVIDLVDMILVMTVNPGFGGQAYIATMANKISQARQLAQSADHLVEVEVDGGISPSTVVHAVKAGARALVAGSSLFRHPEGLKSAVSELRSLALANI